MIVEFDNYYSLKKLVREIKILKFLSSKAPALFLQVEEIILERASLKHGRRRIYLILERAHADVGHLLDSSDHKELR